MTLSPAGRVLHSLPQASRADTVSLAGDTWRPNLFLTRHAQAPPRSGDSPIEPDIAPSATLAQKA
jgi:hypothetical protein